MEKQRKILDKAWGFSDDIQGASAPCFYFINFKGRNVMKKTTFNKIPAFLLSLLISLGFGAACLKIPSLSQIISGKGNINLLTYAMTVVPGYLPCSIQASQYEFQATVHGSLFTCFDSSGRESELSADHVPA